MGDGNAPKATHAFLHAHLAKYPSPISRRDALSQPIVIHVTRIHSHGFRALCERAPPRLVALHREDVSLAAVKFLWATKRIAPSPPTPAPQATPRLQSLPAFLESPIDVDREVCLEQARPADFKPKPGAIWARAILRHDAGRPHYVFHSKELSCRNEHVTRLLDEIGFLRFTVLTCRRTEFAGRRGRESEGTRRSPDTLHRQR